MRTTLGRAIACLAGLIACLALLPGIASAAPAPTCVGLIVDSGQSKPATACIPFHAGLTGKQVLQKGGHKLTFASNGLLCQIDGYPKACTSDAKHYWSYYLRAPGASAWKYASAGPATQKVQSKETDGWVYLNGADRKPPATTYQSISATTATKAATSSDGGGSHTGLIVAVVVIVVIGATQLAVRRRRRAG